MRLTQLQVGVELQITLLVFDTLDWTSVFTWSGVGRWSGVDTKERTVGSPEPTLGTKPRRLT